MLDKAQSSAARLHECPGCTCPQPPRERDPRFRDTPRVERWAWLLLSLVTGVSYGMGADGKIAQLPMGRRYIVGAWWSGRWSVRKYRRLRRRLLAGPPEPCGCRFNRFTGEPMGGCVDHLFERLVVARNVR